jgi:hypothetical protein
MLKAERVALVVFTVGVCLAQVTAPLLIEYDRLKVNTALLAPSSGVDESPLWSPDSKRVGVNVEGKWYQIDTTRVQLQPADWHHQRIGRVASGEAVSQLDPSEVTAWQKVTRTDSTAIVDNSGDKLEFVRKDLRTALVVTAKGRKPLQLWKSDLENCGDLSLSPDGQWVAFTCEENGVFVMNLDRGLRRR